MVGSCCGPWENVHRLSVFKGGENGNSSSPLCRTGGGGLWGPE